MQSTYDQRLFLYTAATNSFKDISFLNIWSNETAVENFNMQVGDYIYISSFLPFNHKYFKFATPDLTPRHPIVETLNTPDEWTIAVDEIDYTDGMRKNGVIGWVPDRMKNWGLVSNSKTDITAFLTIPTSPTIYDSYWMRISFDSPNAFDLRHIGQKFSTDADLYQEYPLLKSSAILNTWKTGKTDWDDQHLTAAVYICKDLIQRNLMFSNNQVLDIASLRSPAIHRTASIIYTGLGARNYAEEIKLSAQNYRDAMQQDKFGLDVNANARRDRFESTMVTTSRASR